MLILTSLIDSGKPFEKKSIKWSKLFWWQWMFAVMAPLLLIVTKSAYVNQDNNGQQYGSTVFSEVPEVDIKETPKKESSSCCKKTAKVGQDPDAIPQHTLKFSKQEEKAISSDQRNNEDLEKQLNKNEKEWGSNNNSIDLSDQKQFVNKSWQEKDSESPGLQMKVKESSRGEGNLQLNSHVSLGEEDIRISKRESSLNLKKTPATPNRVSVNGLKQSQDIMKPRENSYKVIEDEEAVDKTVKNDIKVDVKPI